MTSSSVRPPARTHARTHLQRTARHALSCIVKSPYAGGFGLDLLSQMDVYDKELVMYETVLPRLRSALVRHAVDAELVANTIHVSHATKAIVFEDLALQGFRMPARSDGLDAEHARRALHKLAVFHAGCAHLHERDATVFQKHFRHGECGGFGGVGGGRLGGSVRRRRPAGRVWGVLSV